MIHHILCADVGGTHSRFAHFTWDANESVLRRQYTCPTAQIRTTQDALEAMRFGTGVEIEKASVHIWGVAAIVLHNGLEAQMTNTSLRFDFAPYSWIKNGENFFLLNDFTLQAWASLAQEVPVLPLPWSPFAEHPNMVRHASQTHGILGAGTGLGAAALVPHMAQGWTALSSEAGHMDMTFHGKEEEDFARFAKQRLQQDRLSAEDVLCARALSLLHAYEHGEDVEPAQAATSLWRKEQAFPNESLSLRLYARFLGRFCRQWALSTFCTGGLYLGGGVLFKNPAIVQSESFREEFFHGPSCMQDVLRAIPMGLMQHDMASLWGAVQIAKNHLRV